MKHWRISLALFLFFAGVLSGVSHLDTQSLLYQNCVRDVMRTVSTPSAYPQELDDIWATLKTPDARFEYGGETCPPFLKRHEQIIEAYLTDSEDELPKNVPPFIASLHQDDVL